VGGGVLDGGAVEGEAAGGGAAVGAEDDADRCGASAGQCCRLVPGQVSGDGAAGAVGPGVGDPCRAAAGDGVAHGDCGPSGCGAAVGRRMTAVRGHQPDNSGGYRRDRQERADQERTDGRGVPLPDGCVVGGVVVISVGLSVFRWLDGFRDIQGSSFPVGPLRVAGRLTYTCIDGSSAPSTRE
jgi:hypothetical protein